MDAIKFLQARNRMCNEERCYLCPFGIASNERCVTWLFTHPAEAVAIAEEWDVKHPAKTNRDKFFEVFGIDPRPAGYQQNHKRAEGLATEWWDRPYEEPKGE